MKYALWPVMAVAFLAIAMAAWSITGRLLTAKDDMSVIMGIGVAGVTVGLLAALVAYFIHKALRSVSATATLDSVEDRKTSR